jgi:hypothetical protein
MKKISRGSACPLQISGKSGVIILFLFVVLVQAQISFRNQSEYAYWQDDKRNVWENWADLTYQYDFFRTGLRFETNNPPDPYIFNQSDLVHKNELTFRFVEANYKSISARIGNFYSTFGRGMILRTYEDRNLHVDNNIDGLQLKHRGEIINAQVLVGKIRDLYNRREETIYGFDTDINPYESFRIGGSFLAQSGSHGSVWALRNHFIKNWWDLYLELTRPSWSDDYSFYSAVSATSYNFAITAEYKTYSDLQMQNKYAINYANGPALCREHSYTLLNRHPHELDMNDERGYQLELIWFPNENWQLTGNYSFSEKHSSQRLFEEYYFELAPPSPFRNFSGILGIDWQYDAVTNTENITPLTDLYYDINAQNQLHLILQHQHSTNIYNKSEYDTELLIIEYSHSPWLTLAMVGEYTNKDQLRNVNLDRNTWLYGNIILSFRGKHQLSLLYGTRQEGFVCIGGVCRYEPEFKGVEIKLTNRF